MLRVIIDETEMYNEETEEFFTQPSVNLVLEHSLVSVSKWESKHQKPFLTVSDKSQEEIFDYVRFMIISHDDLDPGVIFRLGQSNFDAINDYMSSSQSATTFGDLPEGNKVRGEIITSELVYFWMIEFNIPFECQHWHLNRLFSLIKICNVKRQKPKRMPKHAIAQRYREINERRKAELNTPG